MNQMGTLVSDGRSFSNSWDGRSISSSCGSSKSTSSSGSKVRPIKATQSFGMPSPTATRSSKSKKLHTLDRSHSSKDGRSKDMHGFRRSVSLNMATSASYLIGEWPKADSLIAQAYFCPSNLTLNKTTQTPNEWCQSESSELCPNKSDSEQPSSVAGENLKFNNIKARLSRRESKDMSQVGSPGHISLINNRQLMLPNKPAAVAYPSPSTTSKLWDETIENFDQLSCGNKSVVHRSTMTQTCHSSLLINDDQKKQRNNFFDSSKNKFSFPLAKLHFNRLPPDGSDHFYSMKEIGLGKEIGLEAYDLLVLHWDDEVDDAASLSESLAEVLAQSVPKFGLLVPNRIFVGGISADTSETDLKLFFSTYGPVKHCKIVVDKSGVSKGYGFVTFALVEDVEKLMKREGEHIMFKDRKLNIGPAVRKQPTFPQFAENPAAAAAACNIVYANGIPYMLQSGVPGGAMSASAAATAALFPAQDNYIYPAMQQMAASHMPMMVLPQPGGYPFQGGSMMGAGGHPYPLVQNQQLPYQNYQTMVAGSGLDQYVYQMPAMYYPQAASMPQYQMLDIAGQQQQLIDTARNEQTSVKLEPGLGSGGPVQVQYFDMPQMPSSMTATSTTGMMASSSTGAAQKPLSQSVGIKRAMGTPRQMMCPQVNQCNYYGMPAVKILAGQGQQRIVTQVVNESDLQMIRKPPN